jgi:hypothetical protein
LLRCALAFLCRVGCAAPVFFLTQHNLPPGPISKWLSGENLTGALACEIFRLI